MHQTSALVAAVRARYRWLTVINRSGRILFSRSPETASACPCRQRKNRQRQQAASIQRQRQQA
jgi:hypothetical protein